MSTPFATSFAYEYLCKLGLEGDEALSIAQENLPAINKFLEHATTIIRDGLITSNDIHLDHKRRFDLYKLISDHFFHYAYVRCWEFKPNEKTFPVGIDRSIFETGADFSECAVKFFWHDEQFDPEFLRHLDIQARQWIYVYCFENGINFGFY
jgi:hypothetical protein